MQDNNQRVSQVIKMQSEEIDRLNDDLQRCREMVSLLSNVLAQHLSYEEIENIVNSTSKPRA